MIDFTMDGIWSYSVDLSLHSAMARCLRSACLNLPVNCNHNQLVSAALVNIVDPPGYRFGHPLLVGCPTALHSQ